MNDSTFYGIIIGFIILLLLIILSAIFRAILNTSVDIFDANIINKLKNKNYEMLEVKRKISPSKIRTPFMFLPVTDDIIEVYGVIKKHNKDLIYTIDWSENNMNKINDIVNELNVELKK
jgi:uncharacterized membrane protein YhiD involved in acid resistance